MVDFDRMRPQSLTPLSPHQPEQPTGDHQHLGLLATARCSRRSPGVVRTRILQADSVLPGKNNTCTKLKREGRITAHGQDRIRVRSGEPGMSGQYDRDLEIVKTTLSSCDVSWFPRLLILLPKFPWKTWCVHSPRALREKCGRPIKISFLRP